MLRKKLICKQIAEGIMSCLLWVLAEKVLRRQKRLASVFERTNCAVALDFFVKRRLLYDLVYLSAHLALINGSIKMYDYLCQ